MPFSATSAVNRIYREIPCWFGDTRQSRRQIFTLNETHTFGPSLVNEARFGLTGFTLPSLPNLRVNPTDFFINEGVNQPIGRPQISITRRQL